MKTIKCAWCGSVVPLTKNAQRPKQHTNGQKTCVGSSQLAFVHENIRKVQPKQ